MMKTSCWNSCTARDGNTENLSLLSEVDLLLRKKARLNKEQVRKGGLPPLVLGGHRSGGKPPFLTCSLSSSVFPQADEGFRFNRRVSDEDC